MKKLLLMSILAMICVAGFSPNIKYITIVKEPPIEPLEALFKAQVMIESSGNTRALNVKEQSYGILQIRAIRLEDYARRTGKRYKLTDCYDPKISKEVWLYYASKFNPYDYEGISRAWNCNSQAYWIKVKQQLKSKL
jgi:hypothetical protein